MHRNLCIPLLKASSCRPLATSMPKERSRRRRGKVYVQGLLRADLLIMLALMVSSTEAIQLFKRSRGTHSGWSKGKNLGKEKVREDVSWMLEDTSEGGWKTISDGGHVTVWKRSMPGSDFVAIKSSATLAVSPQALFEVLTPGDIDIVRKYNPMVEDGTDLEVIDRDNKVSWSATMGFWPCRPRDFVTHIRRATLADGSVAIVNSATIHPKAPESGRYVRGEILNGVFHIKAAKNKKHSQFTMVHHFNPGGNVPAWLMNWLAERKPAAFVQRLEGVAKQWDEAAAKYKNMPCKGRGFADKPCAFLLSQRDSQPDDFSTEAGWRGWLIALGTMGSVATGWWIVVKYRDRSIGSTNKGGRLPTARDEIQLAANDACAKVERHVSGAGNVGEADVRPAGDVHDVIEDRGKRAAGDGDTEGATDSTRADVSEDDLTDGSNSNNDSSPVYLSSGGFVTDLVGSGSAGEGEGAVENSEDAITDESESNDETLEERPIFENADPRLPGDTIPAVRDQRIARNVECSTTTVGIGLRVAAEAEMGSSVRWTSGEEDLGKRGTEETMVDSRAEADADTSVNKSRDFCGGTPTNLIGCEQPTSSGRKAQVASGGQMCGL